MNIVATIASTLVAKSHINGLKHLNMTNDGAYCALLVVNTPITDNSGVAHGVEHFVFRRSLAFTQPESLFQITALTDVKMNASTLENVTYFHCQSQCQQTFLVALNYLLNGVLCPDFHPDDLNHEIHNGGQCGVIYRELLGIEYLKKHAPQQENSPEQKNKEKASQPDYQYGGKSELIGQLTLNDLSRFHQQFYQANDITLVTANTDFSQVSELIKALPESGEPQLSSFVHKPVEQQTLMHQKTKHQKIKQKQLSNGCNNTKKDKQQKKYSPEINHLVEVYHQWLNSQPQQSLNMVKDSSDKHEKYEKHECNNAEVETIDVNNNNIIAPLSELAALLPSIYKLNSITSSNTPTAQYKLPALFNDLLQQAQHQLLDNKVIYVADQQNGLFLAAIDRLNLTDTLLSNSKVLSNDKVLSNNMTLQAQSHIASHIISAYPKFLAPRCQGHCYLIQALVIEQSKYFAIYTAFDVNANSRNKTMRESLLQLGQDLAFINKSIMLAKIKFCRAHQLELQQVDDITPASTAAFINTLSQLSERSIQR